jgi:single-strand DNA-binding protein
MSYNYNHVTLVGRLTKDPESKQIKENRMKLFFTLATNRPYKKDNGESDADYIPISLFGKTAEYAKKLLKKGSPVLIWGRLEIRNYEKNDERRWMTEVIAENFQLLERKQAFDDRHSTAVAA